MCVKMAAFVNYWENHVNSFKNLLQSHQSECYQIWVTALGQGPDKLQVQWSYFWGLGIRSFSSFLYLGQNCWVLTPQLAMPSFLFCTSVLYPDTMNALFSMFTLDGIIRSNMCINSFFPIITFGSWVFWNWDIETFADLHPLLCLWV